MVLTFSNRRVVAGEGRRTATERALGSAYAWSGFFVMWAFWICLVIFLANPARLAKVWPVPMIDQGSGLGLNSIVSALIDLGLIALFGLQHSLMARPWFKAWWAASIPPAFERCTFVHMANLALFAVILFWQPIPTEIWTDAQFALLAKWRHLIKRHHVRLHRVVASRTGTQTRALQKRREVCKRRQRLASHW